jgi:ubiquinone/menaquinone biosynthesis C-methylase UbiE
MNEINRIKDAYARRDSSGKKALYQLFNPAALFMNHQREKAILNTLKKAGISELSSVKILDLGCGTGGVLREFVKYGASPENCFGFDLLPERIETAKQISSSMNFQCGNAESLPYQDSFFDIILCFTVFTSIFDKTMKQNIAKEMLRVLKPQSSALSTQHSSGFILWYDYHINNPKNPDVRGVKAEEIHELFPDCQISLKRITLAPPLARTVAPHSSILCQLLEKIPLLCTHYLGIIRKIK